MSLLIDIILMSDVELNRYLNKIGSAGATLRNREATKTILKFYKNKQWLQDIRLLVAPEMGLITRDDGTDVFVPTLVGVTDNNVTQTTAASQPYLSGDIAPNEKYSLNNPNGASRFMEHSAISYAANEAWTWTGIYNGNYLVNSENINILRTNLSLPFRPSIRYQSGGSFQFRSSNNVANNFNYLSFRSVGKNTIFTLVANGIGGLGLYVNGNLIENKSGILTDMIFEQIIGSGSVAFSGKCILDKIQNRALSASDVLDEYNMLRSIFPEVESVQIGTQTWATSNFEAVCTPMGNLIPEMQTNANTEKITVAADRDFSSDTGFWGKEDATITIAGGVCNFSTTPTGKRLFKNSLLTAGKYYKVVYTVLNYSSGSIAVNIGGTTGTVVSANGTYTQTILCGAGNILYWGVIGTSSLQIDNVSVQEIGWAGSTELYDAIYSQTGGTVEQKTYAAVKAAAMWCYYNNDVANGAIYGKLYNWYAAKLLQMDIDYYNAANPSNLWGWRVPTQSDFNTLATTLGGTSVAGGKMKVAETKYWNSPNTGATNESGFSGIGAGVRIHTGIFGALKGRCVFYYLDFTNSIKSVITHNSTELQNIFDFYVTDKINGFVVRLIKS